MTPERSKATKNRRREFRVADADDDLLVEAAGLVGMSVSEFLLDRALPDAEALVRAHRTIELRPAAFERFMAALDAPPKRLERLAEQAAKARRLKRVD